MHWSYILTQIIPSILGAVGGSSGLYAAFKMVPKIIDRARLVNENVELHNQVEDLRGNLDTMLSIAESSKAALESLQIELALAIRYIADLTQWLKAGGKAEAMPSAPPQLLYLLAKHDAKAFGTPILPDK